MQHTPPTAIIRFDRPLTQEEAAQVLGVTRGAVSLVERRALRKMRKGLERVGVCLAEVLKLPPGMTNEPNFRRVESHWS